ncbi:MAG TPA: hypothetical protein VG844_12920, partial [Terracidiphilus sp.]|nr:hypothetical protein [Terracidiphilus sp.]
FPVTSRSPASYHSPTPPLAVHLAGTLRGNAGSHVSPMRDEHSSAARSVRAAGAALKRRKENGPGRNHETLLQFLARIVSTE